MAAIETVWSVRVGLATNGMLLTAGLWQELIYAGLASIAFILDSVQPCVCRKVKQ